MYTARFGLERKPFELTPDPDFLYLSPTHQEALAALKYGIWQRRGLIRLVGEIGTGKSTLLRALMNELDPSLRTAWINHTTVDSTELLRLLLDDLEIDHGPHLDRLSLLQTLQHFLIGEAQAGNEAPLLIVDEAQNLSDEALEELRLISNLETDQRKLAQILIVGQPELEVRMEAPQLRNFSQRVAVRAWLFSAYSARDRRVRAASSRGGWVSEPLPLQPRGLALHLGLHPRDSAHDQHPL